MADVNKLDSNVTGLRYAEEDSFKTLPASPTWYPLEPNSYADFGGDNTLLARNPINQSRQRKKGVITDLDATGAWNQDLTQTNLQRLLQGFFFADFRTKGEDAGPLVGGVAGVTHTPITPTAADGAPALEFTEVDHGFLDADGPIVFTEVTTLPGNIVEGTEYWVIVLNDDTFSVATSRANAVAGTAVAYASVGSDDNTVTRRVSVDGTSELVYVNDEDGFLANSLIFLAGYGVTANNGLKSVSAVAVGELTVNENVLDETVAPAAATIVAVGYEFATATLDVDESSQDLPRLVRASGAVDFTTLGLVPGEWIYVGGDGAGESFVGSENNGFKRVRAVGEDYIELDKSTITMTDETGSGLTVRLFHGRVLKNETGTDIVRRTYNIERTLGAPDDALPAEVQSEYITGAVPSELTINFAQADKINVDLSFVAGDSEQRTGSTGVKSGTRPALEETDAFNTSSDFSRIKLAAVSSADEAPVSLFAFASELSLSVNNNLSPNKALATLGAFEVTAGSFAISGSITAYFADVAAISAVRDNTDMTVDLIAVKDNAGIAIDLPLLALGGGQLDVSQDEAIMLPLTMDAATAAGVDSGLDHTLLMVFFDYLPDVAAA